jgi:GntR family transcriptional regulator
LVREVGAERWTRSVTTASARTGVGSAVLDEIRRRIESGRWRAGDRLPPEPELAHSLGVSRATLREALRLLAEDGWLSRTRGAGTYVTHRPRLRNNLDINFGVSTLIESVGMRPGTENLHSYSAVATSVEAERLGIPPGTTVHVIERVRTADDVPVIFSRDVIPVALLGGHEETLERLGQGSLYGFLEEEFGLVVAQGIATIKPMKADRWLAAQLRIPTGTLLLQLLQVDYDESGRAMLMSVEYHVSDAFEVAVVRRGPRRTV